MLTAITLVTNDLEDLGPCSWLLESPNSLTPTWGNRQMIHKNGKVQMSSHGRTSKLWSHHITKVSVADFEPATNKNDNID